MISPGDYVPFFEALGWLAAFALAALLPTVSGAPGQRHAGWLIALCAVRLLVEAQALTFPAGDASTLLGDAGHWQRLAAILSGALFWEYARRLWNDRGGRRISAATHLVAAELTALILAVELPLAGAAQPDWFAPLDLLAWLLPGLLSTGALVLVWHSLAYATDRRHTRALRLAAVGIALCHTLAAIPALTSLTPTAPWLVAAGLAASVFALPATRTAAPLGFGTALLLSAALGPIAVVTSLESVARAERNDLLQRAQRAAATIPRTLLASLDLTATSAETLGLLAPSLPALLAQDPLLRGADLWQVRNNQIASLRSDAASRIASTDELIGIAHSRAFIQAATPDRALVTVHVPLRGRTFDSPTAWLALEYPDAFWAVQRRQTRRSAIAVAGLVAGFCAIGFVLASRQAIENSHRVAIERALSADKAKTEFLAFLSHEMRTPLQTILGRTELLRASENASAETTRHAAAIETQGRLLLRLVTDLLDLGTIEAGKLQLQPAPFRLRALIASIAEQHSAAAAAKHLSLQVEIPEHLPDSLIGDEARLRQILGNLLSNAVKYTRRGSVTLRITADSAAPHTDAAAGLAFSVSDTGPGLPPDKIPQLFTLFTRLDSGDTFTREGTGVGLALVRRLCDLMGGTVSAENLPESGARFIVRLRFPLHVDAADATASDSSRATRRAATQSLDILVAEDNTATREFLVEALTALGHRPCAVADGDAALATATARRFDAALLDINLPGRDGVTLARLLSAQPHPPRLIGCSAEAFAHTREAALAAGMEAFLQKPVTLPALSTALATAPATSVDTAANLFTRLQAPEVTARTLALLAAEWPAQHAAAQAALDRGDFAPLAALAHHLQSSALLAGHSKLLAHCRALSAAAARHDSTLCHATLETIAHQVPDLASQPAPLA